MQIFAAELAEKARLVLQRIGIFLRLLPDLLRKKIRQAPGAARNRLAKFGQDSVTTFRALPYILSNFGHRSRDFALSFNSMFVVVFKRLRHNLGLSISGIIGIIAVLAMVVCVPVFSHAVSSQVLRSQLEEKAVSTHRGLFSLHMYVVDQASASALSVEIVNTIRDILNQNTQSIIGTQVAEIVIEMQTASVNWRPVKKPIQPGYK